jgi:small subunit ribosomal protein S23
MVRRLALQVHKTVSRLKEAKLIPEPTWFQAVLQHPPLPIPPRGPPPRTKYDTPATEIRKSALRPRSLPIVYLEDKVRRRFFADHPFEALRARSLTEVEGISPPHPIQGKAWTRLAQHGSNPMPEECAFKVKLCACLI